jgi:hypothetical protein
MYKLQRKDIDQSSEEAISSEDETTCIQLVINWKVNNSGEFCMILFLVEHDKSYVWDRDGLMKPVKHYASFNIQHGPIKET